MNLDDLTQAWRSQDLSSLHGMDKTLLHQMLRQEQAKLEKQLRRMKWVSYFVNAFLLGTAVLFLAIMINPKDDDVLSAWDYLVGVVGVVAAIILGGAVFAIQRRQKVREQGFGDSLRDHLRRRIARLSDPTPGGRRLLWIILAATLICGWAISIAGRRIDDVPYSEFNWSPLWMVVIFVLIYLFFRWTGARARRRNLPRRRQLEALLKELDGQ